MYSDRLEKRRSWHVFMLGMVLAAGTTWGTSETLLGPALELTKAERLALTTHVPNAGPVADSIGGFTIDTANRLEVLTAYHCIYQASSDWPATMNWVGNVGACNEGTVSQDFHDHTRRRINYFRAMAGLYSDITFDSTKNQKCQKAALIMSRNNGLSHEPIDEHPGWSCLTADGDEAAGQANLSLSSGTFYSGPDAVDGQIEDSGGNNLAVGHRRWLLYPPAREMGNGGIPGQGSYGSSGVIWVVGDFAPPPATPTPVSWPSPGYVPYSVVYPRWSFSLADANFDNAMVSMTVDGVPLFLMKVHPTPSSPAAFIGDPTIVWEPFGVQTVAPDTDITYTVTISGITGAAQSSYTYDVTLVDPNRLAAPAVISGPANPPVGVASTYTFTPIAGAASYHVRKQAYADTGWVEGGEDGAGAQLLDGTDASYSVTSTDHYSTGSRSLHLAFTDITSPDQWVELDRTLRPSATSQLIFQYTRRWCSQANDIVAEVSDDDGLTWQPVWQINGVCPAGGGSCSSTYWDSGWLPASIPLAAYADTPIRLRFAFNSNGWYFQGTDGNMGVFFDDITISHSEERTQETTETLAGDQSSFSLSPATIGTHVLAVQPTVGCHAFPYGPNTTVASVAAPRAITLGQPLWTGSQWRLDFSVSGTPFAAYELQHAIAPAGPWTNAPGAQYYAAPPRFTTPATADYELLRIKGSD